MTRRADGSDADLEPDLATGGALVQPDDIRNKSFPMHRRGFDPDLVRAFLQQVAEAWPRPGGDTFEDAGREVAFILRTAHEEATRIRNVASTEAETIRADAELGAAELRAEAQDDREKAKRLLQRSRERADIQVAEAEERAAALMRSAENQARSRADSLVEETRKRLERVMREEQQARERLMAVQAELQAVIRRITGPGAVIDLTSAEPSLVTPGEQAPETSGPTDTPTSSSAVLAPVGVVATPAAVAATSGNGAAARQGIFEEDPLATMVRSAVDRAVASSAASAPPAPSQTAQASPSTPPPGDQAAD